MSTDYDPPDQDSKIPRFNAWLAAQPKRPTTDLIADLTAMLRESAKAFADPRREVRIVVNPNWDQDMANMMIKDPIGPQADLTAERTMRAALKKAAQ